MNGSSTLHSGKDLAVSLFLFLEKFIRIAPDTWFLSKPGVTVRTSRLAAYGSYPLPAAEENASASVRTFLTTKQMALLRDNPTCLEKELQIIIIHLY